MTGSYIAIEVEAERRREVLARPVRSRPGVDWRDELPVPSPCPDQATTQSRGASPRAVGLAIEAGRGA